MISRQVKTMLRSVIDSFNAMKNVPGISDKQLSRMIQNLIGKYQEDLKNITREAAIAELDRYDQDRHAWTVEDIAG
jgi:hypothetical protein